MVESQRAACTGAASWMELCTAAENRTGHGTTELKSGGAGGDAEF